MPSDKCWGRHREKSVSVSFLPSALHARAGDDVIIVVESSSTGRRGEPYLPQVPIVGCEGVVIRRMCWSLYADHGIISFQEAMQCLHNALIRTHHITSRKKVAKLKQAATFHDVFVLLRYGGAPGVMYVEGKADGVNQWVSDVQVSRRAQVSCLDQSDLIVVPESSIQRLPARLSHRRRTP